MDGKRGLNSKKQSQLIDQAQDHSHKESADKQDGHRLLVDEAIEPCLAPAVDVGDVLPILVAKQVFK